MHTYVFVIVPIIVIDIIPEVARLLAGSQRAPEKKFEQMEYICGCRGRVAEKEIRKSFDNSARGKILWAQIKHERRRQNKNNENKLLIKRHLIVKETAKNHLGYLKFDPSCNVCDGSGMDIQSSDPREHWDNWRIGGKWTPLFDSIVLEPINDALQGYVTIIKKNQWNIASQPGAIVTPDGKWFGTPWLMESGIYAKYAEEGSPRKQWENITRELFTKYYQFFAVVVDCHL